MSAWLVGHVPSWLLLIGVLVLVVGLSVLVQILVRRRFPRLAGEEHNDVLRFAAGVVVLVFTFFIGFVVSVRWGEINAADERARAEGAAGVQLVARLHVFAEPDSERIRVALLRYEEAAVVEWDVAANGGSYPPADRASNDLRSAYEQVQASNDLQKTMLTSSFTDLDDLSTARTERVLQAQTEVGPPWPLWGVILLTTALLMGCSIVYGVANPASHVAMVASLAVLVGMILYLVLMLSHPYLGEIAASPEPLREVIRALSPNPP
ncbi:hypothetical protein ACQPX6_29820 [Actinomycetospora sp. CA-101289]|uniref:bestrophin-like domain n=1 Tax=Actinomycetospora sp. CA-101289 TaxID=3239893 RepID=UPI003D97D18D